MLKQLQYNGQDSSCNELEFPFNANRKWFFIYFLAAAHFLKHTFLLSEPLPPSLTLQASHQLRFLREWAVFGRALRRSVWELLGVALALLLLVLAYSHTGHLVRLPLLFVHLLRVLMFSLSRKCLLSYNLSFQEQQKLFLTFDLSTVAWYNFFCTEYSRNLSKKFSVPKENSQLYM